MIFPSSTLRPLGTAILGTAMFVASCGSDDGAPAGEEPATLADTVEPDAEVDGTAPPAELDDGWTRAEGDGYSVGLPPGWFDANRALDDDEFMADLADELQNLSQDDLAGIIDENANIDLLAFRISDLTSEFATNVNFLTVERGPLDEPEIILDQAEEIVATFGAELTGTDEYDVAGVPSVEVSYDLELPDVDVVGIQSYLFADETVVVGTYTAVDPDPALWQSILGTFSVT